MAQNSVALGTFDGVHIAHRMLLEKAHESRTSSRLIAVTFDRVPSSVLGMQGVPQIVTCQDKVSLLYAAGADTVEVIPFDKKLYSTEPEDFFKDILIGRYDAGSIAVGYDYRFGRAGRGDVSLLSELCDAADVDLIILGEVSIRGLRVSSSEIRRGIMAGDSKSVNEMLGRVHFFRASRNAGAWTINEGIALPPEGVRFKTTAMPHIPISESFDGYDSIFWLSGNGKDARLELDGEASNLADNDIYLLFGPKVDTL